MKTIFAKYNREREPAYQTVTKIVVDKNNKRYSLKEPLCFEANKHIEKMQENYKLLKSQYNINLVKPNTYKKGLLFEMAEGTSLENILLGAYQKNNEKVFQKYINLYFDFVDKMVAVREILFEPSREFVSVFGNWRIKEPQDIIKVSNIDLIFGNIFVNDNDEFTLIDYEWVFDFEIPKSYIIWRGLALFSLYHNVDVKNFLNNIEMKYDEFFEGMDAHFSDYVFGVEKKYFPSQAVSKSVNFFNSLDSSILPSSNYVAIMQIEQKSQTITKSLPVMQNINLQEFKFDLSCFEEVTKLRLHPLNESCMIEIDKITLKKFDGEEVDLTHSIETNATGILNNRYYFESKDGYVYLHNDFTNAKELFVCIRYLKFEKEAQLECIKHLKRENLKEFISFSKKIDNSKLVFMGASGALEKAWESLNEYGIISDYICDNDSEKHGKQFKEYKIYSADELFSRDEKFIVLITSSYVNEIKAQLKQYECLAKVDSVFNLVGVK